MALITCPECGNKVSDAADECIHCGYPLHKQNEGSLIINNLSQLAANQTIEAYDVMLVDYNDIKLTTLNNLRKLLNISFKEANTILSTLPSYIYNDIPKQDAEYIARKLMNMNMRVAVYDPIGNVRYYEPPRYINRPLPIVAPMPRQKRVVIPKPYVQHMPKPSPSPLMNLFNKPKQNKPKPATVKPSAHGKKGK